MGATGSGTQAGIFLIKSLFLAWESGHSADRGLARVGDR